MNRRVTILVLLTLLPAFLSAESVLPENIKAGKLVPESTSPDKKYCLLEVFHSDTTQNSVIFATTDRTNNLGYASLHTVWSTDISYRRRAIILWAPDSHCVALHDSLDKHSVVTVYRLADERFDSVTLPDLLEEACRTWKVERSALMSSGQRPLRWDANDALSVEVAAKLNSGKRLSTVVRVRITGDSAAIDAKK